MLDETDNNYLRRRCLAKRDHEPSEANAMLQRMRNLCDVFLCMTRLFDASALRRFTFKLRFKPLKPVQRERGFIADALRGDVAGLGLVEQRACAYSTRLRRRLRCRQAPDRGAG